VLEPATAATPAARAGGDISFVEAEVADDPAVEQLAAMTAQTCGVG
jgi:hypothetical protein